jgi:hypothetical protein
MKIEPRILKTDDGEIRIHVLKVWPKYFAAINEKDELKRKTVEIRKFDRDFRVGDFLWLQEYDPETEKLGDVVYRQITHILDEQPWVPEGYAALSIIDRAPAIQF